MKRAIVITLALAMLAGPARAEDDVAAELLASGQVRAEVLISTEAPYVGQRTSVVLRLATSSFFQGAPTWRVPEIGGAIVRQESQFGVNGSAQIDGETFATQDWEIVAYPQRLGAIEVPSVEVTMIVSNEGKKLAVTTRTEPVTFETRLPEGATADAFAMSAPAFYGKVEFDRDLDGLRVGDAVRRTVTLTVEGAPAMLIPPLRRMTFDGVSAYPDPPLVDDEMNRGQVTGTRVESTAFVFERPGRYVIPAMRIPWFDLDDATMKDVEFAEVVFDVAENTSVVVGGTSADVEPEEAADNERPAQWPIPLAVILTVLVAGVIAYRRLAPWLRRRVEARRAEQAETESAYFERFDGRCRANDAHGSLAALLAWLDKRAAPASGSLADFVAASESPALASAVEDLQDRLYGREANTAGWSGEPLRAAVESARARHEEALDPETAPIRLNPSSRRAI